MAGLYDFLVPTATVRTPSHSIQWAMIDSINGFATNQELLDYVEAQTNGPVTQEWQQDLGAIRTVLGTKSTQDEQLAYVQLVHSACGMTEDGWHDEAAWRNRLGI